MFTRIVVVLATLALAALAPLVTEWVFAPFPAPEVQAAILDTPALCGVALYMDGAPVWVALPCGALTPQPSVAYTPPATGVPASRTPTATAMTWTPTRTWTPSPTPPALVSASPTPSATSTPWHTPTPEVWTSTPTPPYCKAVPDGSYRVNIRVAPTTGATVVGQVQIGEWVEITGEVQDAGGAWWLQIDRGWVAGWVMRVDCPGSFLEYGP